MIRDERGRVVGGAMVGDMGHGHPVSIDVAVDPARRDNGWMVNRRPMRGGVNERGAPCSTHPSLND